MKVACGAVALGAGIIEKHFTLDNSRMGMDNNMATEPEAMRDMVEKAILFTVRWEARREYPHEDERVQLTKMRRSIVARMDLSEGTGLEPSMQKSILGKRINRDIKRV